MNDKLKPELMKLLGITDEKVADKILQYAKLVNVEKKKAQNLIDDLNANDYAVAKALNQRVTNIFDMVASNNIWSLDITDINKSYVLLINSLKKIYTRNDKLSAISQRPTWEYFDIIEGCEREIYEYTSNWDNDTGQSHIARVNKLCIIAGKDNPAYTPEIKLIVQEADKAVSAFRKQIENQKLNETADDTEKDWYISEYRLSFSADGIILVNGVLRIKKTQAGSASSKLMEQAIKFPNVLFKPNLGKYSRNLSTTLSGMGFTATLRALFFPTISEDKGIVFRPTVTRTTADDDRIDTAKLDLQLKQLGAKITKEELSIDDIPF
jgi:hypothetical protein